MAPPLPDTELLEKLSFSKKRLLFSVVYIAPPLNPVLLKKLELAIVKFESLR
ncbi:hypothetical protein MBCUR_11710 [Methanobrevibacter curvatus]|uniref:Uncharacterized protein n=1 Tax=Methanobrevibacter curvatus TaxID=49547 RepID=A0A166AJK4_9EURY|nr:hypothetical protein MBCUR_11710 [Methanobrevibacter curvatus]